MLCTQVTKDMISAWDCPITEMNNGSLPENTYWLLALNFTMDNAGVAILQACGNLTCCSLILRDDLWQETRRGRRNVYIQVKLDVLQLIFHPGIFDLYVWGPSLWYTKGRLIAHIWLRWTQSTFFNLSQNWILQKSPPIPKARPPFSSLKLWRPDLPRAGHTFCLLEMAPHGRQLCTRYAHPSLHKPDRISFYLLLLLRYSEVCLVLSLFSA